MLKLKLENLLLRPWRLFFITIILAFAFVYARLILFALLGVILLLSAIKVYVTEKKSYFSYIIPVILFIIIFGVYYIVDYNRVVNYMAKHSPLDLELVLDGTYEGSALGLRGPIKTKVTIEDGKIRDIKVVQHQEAISALNGLKEQVIAQNRLDAELVPPTIHGSIEATEGFRESIT